MLSSISIRDVVLIGRLDLTFQHGLCVLTGETGAGKSILLDALGLAMGARAEARLVRHGAAQAIVTTAFELPEDHSICTLLSEHGLELDGGQLLLRRVLTQDGRSRAFINDQPVSIGLLRDVGRHLVEIHGQFDNQKLLNPNAHRGLLDAYGGYQPLLSNVDAAYSAWRSKADEKARMEADIETARQDEEYLRHAVEELRAINPEPGEESRLSEQRSLMMNAEDLMTAMNEAQSELGQAKGADEKLQKAARALGRVAEKAEGRLDVVITALDRAINEAAEAGNLLHRVSADLSLDPQELDRAEERLFALRALARKHNVQVDDLAALKTRMEDQIAAIEDGGAELARLSREEAEAKSAYVKKSTALTDARKKAAAQLDKAVSTELEALKLGRAVFVTDVAATGEEGWSNLGADKVAFMIATNPGAPAGPLSKIASGGEMARFMLALKVVLAEADPVAAMVFDEVDAGVGGAVAAAVGERLSKLAGTSQVLVVTHSPQVAARGSRHLRVSKSDSSVDENGGQQTLTAVEPLDDGERKEEIARMLAGSKVTQEARAAADSLLTSSR
jgi:DNA repair protein RecN (Recombination protein N)